MPPRTQLHEEDVSRQYLYKDGDIIRRLIRYSQPFRKHFIVIYGIMVVSILLSIYEPIVIGNTFTLLTDSTFTLADLYTNIAIMTAIILTTRVLTYVQNIVLNITGQGIIFNVRKDIFTHLEYHDLQ